MRGCRVLLTLALATLTACSGTSTAPIAKPAPTSTAATPTATPSPTLTPTPTTPTPSRRAARAGGPCGQPAAAPIKHVIWIWMENRSYSDVLGSGGGDAPHLGAYARACGLATHYEAITHPSLPNYLAATSGSTGGVSSDCSPADCPQHRDSLFGQLDAAGLQWRTYAEAMPSPCDRTTQGRYATKHNPAVYFTPIRSRCQQWDLPMSAFDLNHELAAFTFIEPDICDDGHDCTTRFSDEWLGAMLDRIATSPSYKQGGVAVFVTWDEGIGDNQHVATVVISPGVPRGTRAAQQFTHYSLLRTTEALFGLPPLGNATSASDMRAAFGLTAA